MEPTTTLTGGRSVSIQFRDGRTESVFVRELNVDELPGFAMMQADETAMIELCCDQPKGWANALSRQSHTVLITAVEEVNGDFFRVWAERMQRREERLMPGITQRKLDALTSGLAAEAAQPSRGSSPKQPADAA